MYEAVDLVKGAVSIKDLVPVLTHVAIHDGRLCGYNGRIYINAPAPWLKGLSLTVPADQFIAAVKGCGDEEATFTQSEGRLTIACGHFRATLPTLEFIEFPAMPPPEKRRKWKGGLLMVLERLRPFVGSDASRSWGTGILFTGAKAMATNNVVIAQTSIPSLFSVPLILPGQAVDELLRIGLEPIAVTFGLDAATFYLPGDAWLRTSLVEGTWPEGAIGLVGTLHQGAHMVAVPEGLSPAISRVLPFVADPKAPVVLLGEEVKTQDGIQQAQVTGFSGLRGAYRVEPLLAVLKVATHIDWAHFPRVPWRGADLEGVIVGLNL